MINPPAAATDCGLGGGNGDAAPAKNKGPKLTLDDKRSLALKWYLDPAQRSIQEFTPHARPFLRKCAKDLKLWRLRKLRAESTDGGGVDDDDVKAKIMAWRPTQTYEKPEQQGEDNAPTCMDDEAIISLLMGFFDDATDVPLGRYIRQNGALAHRADLLGVVKRVQLRKMKQKRDAEGVRDRVLKKMGRALAERKREMQMQSKKRSADESESSGGGDDDAPLLESCEDGLKKLNLRGKDKHDKRAAMIGSKALRLARSNPERAKSLLLGWFDSPTKKSIVEYLKDDQSIEGPKLRKTLRAMRFLVRKGGLQKMRKGRDTDGVRDEAVLVIDGLLTTADDDDEREPITMDVEDDGKAEKAAKRRRLQATKIAVAAAATNADAEANLKAASKDLLKVWFDDPNMVPLRRLLQQQEKGCVDKAAIVQLVTKGNLRRLRKHREDEGVRSKAMNRIDKKMDLAAKEAKMASKPKVAKVVLRKMVRDTSPDDRAYLTALVSEWFDDEKARALPRFLKEREEAHLLPQVVPLVRRTGLPKLRKNRDDPEVRAVAEQKIAELFHFDEGEGGTANAAPRGIVKKGSKPGRFGGLTKAERETLKSYLVEWFYDDDLSSIDDYLADKGRAEWKPVMAGIVNRQGLRKLRKERVQLRQTVTRKIDNAFRGEAKLARKAKVVPSAPPLEETTTDGEMTDFVDVAEETEAETGEGNFVVIH